MNDQMFKIIPGLAMPALDGQSWSPGAGQPLRMTAIEGPGGGGGGGNILC